MRNHVPLLLCAGALLTTGLQVRADETPAAPAIPSASASDSPVGNWKWFVGRDIAFHEDGTVTYPGNFGTWQWVDKEKRRFRVEWKTLSSVDLETLSEDGKSIRSEGQFPGMPPDAILGRRVVSPLGIWNMNRGANVTFREDHTAAFAGINSGFWYWLDEDARRFKVEWTTIPYVGTFTLTEDGNDLEGFDYLGGGIRGHRFGADAVKASGGQATPATPPAATASLTGTWSWFVGPDLTFQADGTLTGKNRVARWKWTDEGARQLEITWDGVQTGLTDKLTLSTDGKHLEGKNNDSILVTGDKMEPPAGK